LSNAEVSNPEKNNNFGNYSKLPGIPTTHFRMEDSRESPVALTQSQACDTRHREMPEVNSLCTDSGSLRAEYCIVEFHTIQPSSSLFDALKAINFEDSQFYNNMKAVSVCDADVLSIHTNDFLSVTIALYMTQKSIPPPKMLQI